MTFFLSTGAAARELGCSVATLRALVASGRLRVAAEVKQGLQSDRLFDPKDVAALKAQQRKAA